MADPATLIRDNPKASDEEILALALIPTARASDPARTYVTYLSIDKIARPFKIDAGDMRDNLLKWCDAPDLRKINEALPGPGRLSILHSRLDGAKGVDLSDPESPALLSLFASGVDADHPPIINAELAAVLLAIGYVVPTYTLDDVKLARGHITRAAELADAYAAVLAGYNRYAREYDAYVRDGGTPPVNPLGGQ